MFCHTKFQRDILKSVCFCENVEIFVPGIDREDLGQIINFFYKGIIESLDQNGIKRLLDVLISTFGFPKDMKIEQCPPEKVEKLSLQKIPALLPLPLKITTYQKNGMCPISG